MAVAKRQGRSEDQSEDFRQTKQHSWLSPICIGQAQLEEKHIKGGAKALSLGLSLRCACARALSLSFSLSLSPSLSPSPRTPPLLSLRVLDSPAIF